MTEATGGSDKNLARADAKSTENTSAPTFGADKPESSLGSDHAAITCH